MGNETLLFIAKVLAAALIIASASSLAGRHPVLAGFITALPLTSILALTFAHLQTGSGEATSRYAVAIVTALPASLLFFVPFLFYGRFRGNFWLYMALGVALLYAGFWLHRAIATRLLD